MVQCRGGQGGRQGCSRIDRPLTAALDSLVGAIGQKEATLRDLEAKMTLQEMTICRASQMKVNDLLDRMVKINEDLGGESVRQAQSDNAAAFWTMVAAIGVGAIALLGLGVILAKNISKVLTMLIGEAKRLTNAAVEGKLQVRGNPDLISLEFRPIVEGVNATL